MIDNEASMLTVAILMALKREGAMTQTALTELMYGSSGRNNPRLVSFLEALASQGYVTMTKKGRAKLYKLGPAGERVVANR